MKSVPDNIEILADCHDNDFFRELAKCKAVIVPLEDTHISSGQLVIIQAMMYGKPVVVTENDTVKDYVDKAKHIVFDIGSFASASESGFSLKLMQFASKSLDDAYI